MSTKLDIKQFRNARGWSQERLATELGVNQSTVHRWECEREDIKPLIVKALEQIARDHPEPEVAA